MAKLAKGLGLIQLSCIAIGAMISSGLFILPGLAYAQAGPAVIASYFIAGLLALSGVLSMAELTTAMPKAGGDYFYITRGMGPAVGTIAGLLSWFALSLKTAFAVVGMAAFTTLLVNFDVRIIGIVLCIVFVLANVAGVKKAGRIQVVLVVGLLLLMAYYILKGTPAVDVHNLVPFSPRGAAAMLSTAGFVFVSYGGLLKIAAVSEEVQKPGRTIPLALAISLSIVALLYTLMVYVTVGVLPGESLRSSLTPISDAAEVFLGPPGRITLAIAAILAFVSTANAGILAASRYLFALSRDGLTPPWFARISEKHKTPVVAIYATGGFIVVALFLKLEILVEAASSVVILTNILANLSVVVLRESRLQNYRPSFRAPFYPWVQIVGILALAFILFEMGPGAFWICALLVAVGLVTYWTYGRARVDRDYALLHLVERITARELVTGTLEAELKDIIRERDEVVEDRFDHKVEDALIIDIEKSVTVDEFFQTVAEALAPRIKMPAPAVKGLLNARERESSTVLAPGLAIPHIVVEGEGVFEILIARAREGIIFAPDKKPVHAVFVLMGTRDERNFHLRALAAIAQVVQEERFEKNWMSARGEQSLRDLVLLAKRSRNH